MEQQGEDCPTLLDGESGIPLSLPGWFSASSPPRPHVGERLEARDTLVLWGRNPKSREGCKAGKPYREP